MHFDFVPNMGAGPLAFGADRKLVRSHLAPLVPQTQATEPETDFYHKDGFILGYDKDNKLEFIEVFPPSTAEYGGVQLLAGSAPEMLARISDMGHSYNGIHGAYRFDSVGISIYCPRQTIESASLFKAGYYETSS